MSEMREQANLDFYAYSPKSTLKWMVRQRLASYSDRLFAWHILNDFVGILRFFRHNI